MPLPNVTLHYDGWLRLPPEVCQRLDLTTRSTLRVWVEGSTVVLEPDPIVGAMSPNDAEARGAAPAPTTDSTAASHAGTTAPEAEAGEAAPAARERVAAVGDRAETDPELKGPTSEAIAAPKADEAPAAPPVRRRGARKPPAVLAVGSAARPRGRRKTSIAAGDEPPS